MKITKDSVADLKYTLKNDGGEILDTSDGGEPLTYLHGQGGIIPGLEKALEGKGSGEKLHVVIPPAEAYGDRDESLLQPLPLKDFEKPGQVKPGIQFHMNWDGEQRLATVTEVKSGVVTVDLNHPLAGQTLHFDVEVVGVRASTAEERSHGHVHGPHGHHHH